MSARVLVTGAAGFIGSHVVARLLAEGMALRAVDNFDPYYDPAVKRKRLEWLEEQGDFEFVEADVRHPAAAAEFAAGCDAVVHLAARAGVRPSFQHPLLYLEMNVKGTTVLLDACRRAGVRRVALASSSSVYGDTGGEPAREDRRLAPISPYGASKAAAEAFAGAVASSWGLTVGLARLFTVYGPAQRPDQVLHRFATDLTAGRTIVWFGGGASTREYTFVADAVEGILQTLRWTGSAEPGVAAFNIAGGEPVTLARLTALLADALNVEPRASVAPRQSGEVDHTRADLTKAAQVLGYRTRVGIEEGIRQFVRWYEETYERTSRTTG